MPAERFRSSAVLAASSLAAVALLAAHSRGEPVLPPPAPGAAIDSGPLPPAPDDDDPESPTDPDAQHDVLTRGPIHEAFAEQYNDEPTPGLVIPKTPPEPIDELPPETMPDGNNIQWVPGYWGWDDDRQDFIWISGLWRDVPPNQRWVPGYWNQTPNGWQWVSGFWTGAEHAELDYLPQPPATLEQGPNIAAPSDDQFWVPGTWSYVDTGYRWRPGYWAPAYDDWVWVPDRYIWTPYGFVFAPGYYDYRLPVRAVAFAPVYFSNVGWWHVHRRPFCPSVVLDVGPLTMHWWVRPNYCHYYFGDYYAATYYSGWGLQPWYSCSYGFAGHGGVWIGRPCRYDPLFVFYNGYHRRHHHIDFGDRMHHWHNHYRDHVDDRPRHTIREQRAYFADLERHGRNREHNNNVKIGRSLKDFAAHPADHEQKFVKLDGQQRERQRKVANETTQLARLRHDVEGNEGRHRQGNDGQGRQRGNKNGETIALPGVNEGSNPSNGDNGSRHGRKLELPKNQGAGDQSVVNGNGNGGNGDGERRGRKVKTPDGPPGGGGVVSDAGNDGGNKGRSSRRGRDDAASGNNDPPSGNNSGQGDNQRNGRGRRGGQNSEVPGNSLPGLDGNNQDAGGDASKGRSRNRDGGGSGNQNPDGGSSSGGNERPGMDQGSNGGRNSRRGNSGGGGGNESSDIQITPQGQGNEQQKGDRNSNSGRNNSRQGAGSKSSFNFDANGGGGSGNGVAEQGGNGVSGGNGVRSRHSQGRAGNSMNVQGNNRGFVGNGSPGQGGGGNGGGRSGRGNNGGDGQFGGGGGNPGGQGASNPNGGAPRERHSGAGNSGGGGGNRGGGKRKNN